MSSYTGSDIAITDSVNQKEKTNKDYPDGSQTVRLCQWSQPVPETKIHVSHLAKPLAFEHCAITTPHNIRLLYLCSNCMALPFKANQPEQRDSFWV
jgi:hypothetical protein